MRSLKAKAVGAAILVAGIGLHRQTPETPNRVKTDKVAVRRGETSIVWKKLRRHEAPLLTAKLDCSSGAEEAQAAVYEALSAPLNVFVSRREFAEKLLEVDGGVAALIEMVEKLPQEEEETLQGMHERVRAIDLLEALAESPVAPTSIKSHCVDTLERLVMRPLNRRQSKQERRAILGDKMDSLTALIRIDSYRGMLAYIRMSEPQRSTLQRAALLGLVDSGLSRTEAQTYVSGLGIENLGVSERRGW